MTYPNWDDDDYPASVFANDVAFDEAVRQRVRYPEFCQGAEWGAGWAFAIVGMAQAIADGIDEGRFSEEHWEYIGGGEWEQWRNGKLVATRRE